MQRNGRDSGGVERVKGGAAVDKEYKVEEQGDQRRVELIGECTGTCVGRWGSWGARTAVKATVVRWGEWRLGAERQLASQYRRTDEQGDE